MPDFEAEPGKIKYFDASQHNADAARSPGLRFTRGLVLRAATLSLGIVAVMAILATSTGAARRATEASTKLAGIPDSLGGPCTDALRDAPEHRASADRTQLAAAAHDLLALRRQRTALMATLDQPGAGAASFDALAAEVAQLDDEYQRALTDAVRRDPALGAVLAPAQGDPELGLVAVAGGPIDPAAREARCPLPGSGSKVADTATNLR